MSRKNLVLTALTLVVISLGVLSLSISNKQKSPEIPKEVTTIKIDIDGATDRIELPLIDTTNFSIIPLETTDECLIGEITRVFLKNDKIYVYDKITKGVYIFDKSGSYLSKVHSVGAGPMEYLDASDVFVGDGIITMIDYYSRKVFIFDTDGRCLRDFSMEKFWANAVFKVGDRIYYANDGSRTNSGFYALFSSDLNGKDLQKYIPFEEGTNTVIKVPYCYSLIGDNAKLMVSSTDTIYSITKSGVYPEYVLDFMGKRLPEEYRKDNVIELMRKGLRGKYVLDVDAINESDKYLFLSFRYGSDSYYLIYDKSNSMSVLTKSLIPKGIIGIGVNFKRIQDNRLVSVSDTDSLLDLYKGEQENKTKFSRELSQVLKSKSYGDNPILFIFNLK